MTSFSLRGIAFLRSHFLRPVFSKKPEESMCVVAVNSRGTGYGTHMVKRASSMWTDGGKPGSLCSSPIPVIMKHTARSIKVLADLTPREDPLPALQMATFSCSHMAERASCALSSSSYKSTSPIGLGPHPITSFNLYHLLIGPTSK